MLDETVLYTIVVFAILTVVYFIYEKFKPKGYRPPPPPAPTKIDRDPTKPSCTILYGSQTGTAEMYAMQMGNEGKKYGFDVQVQDLYNYPTESLQEEKLVIFIVATYGEGEPTDSSKEFYDWLALQTKETVNLTPVHFAVFGLGDSQYKLFAQIGKLTDSRMEELGAIRAFTRGDGDADRSLEEDFDNWRNELWPHLAKLFNAQVSTNHEITLERTTKMIVFPTGLQTEWRPFPLKGGLTSAFGPREVKQRPLFCKTIENRELLTNSDRSTRHIEFDISETPWEYEGGDHLLVFAPNEDSVVDKYLSVINFGEHTPDTVITVIRTSSGTNQFPTRCTIRNAVKWYLDLTYQPKKDTLKAFSTFTQNELEKAEFQSYLVHNDESLRKYKRLCENLRDTYGWLRKFKSTCVPVDVFLESMPKMQARPYSIATDGINKPKSIGICVAVVDGGLCTNFLKKAHCGDPVLMYVRKSTFHYPTQLSAPVVLVGPGTGIAPLMGFLWRRKELMTKGEKLGQCHFFFGCRRRDEDYLYRNTLEAFEQEGVITKLHVAFSRDSAAKVYVQHLMQQNATDIFETLYSNNGRLYVCGDAKNMARDVETVVKQILQTNAEDLKGSEAVERYLDRLHDEHRYQKDVWSVRN